MTPRNRACLLLSGALLAFWLASPASALSTFETGFTGWTSAGDVYRVDTTFDANIPQGSWGLLLTTFPNDPGNLGPLSGQPIENPASPAVSASVLEAFLGLPADALDAPLSPSGNDAIEGSAVQRTLVVGETFTLRFEFNLLTNETVGWAPDYRDYFFTSLTGQGTAVHADVFSTPLSPSATIFDRETGWGTVEWVGLPAGTYTLGIGVVDVLDADLGTALLIDDVQLIPEAPLVLMLGLGLVRNLPPPLAPHPQ